MTLQLSKIGSHEQLLLDDAEVRKILASFIQSELDSARQILDFIEENIQTAMTTSNYDCWGFIFHELLLCRKQMEGEINGILDDLMEHHHASNYGQSVNELFIEPGCEEKEYTSNIRRHEV
jgi:hypothetical protein